MRKAHSIIIILAALNQLIIGNSCAVAETKGVNNNPIQFTSPIALRCGETIAWSKLNEWKGESEKCGNGLLYTVIGKTYSIVNGLIKANIVVPEDNNNVWPAFNGDTHEVINSKFEVQFCITTKMATRPLLFQAYTQDGKKNGSQCTVTLVGVQLED
jgi:hypothetical protein